MATMQRSLDSLLKELDAISPPKILPGFDPDDDDDDGRKLRPDCGEEEDYIPPQLRRLRAKLSANTLKEASDRTTAYLTKVARNVDDDATTRCTFRRKTDGVRCTGEKKEGKRFCTQHWKYLKREKSTRKRKDELILKKRIDDEYLKARCIELGINIDNQSKDVHKEVIETILEKEYKEQKRKRDDEEYLRDRLTSVGLNIPSNADPKDIIISEYLGMVSSGSPPTSARTSPKSPKTGKQSNNESFLEDYNFPKNPAVPVSNVIDPNVANAWLMYFMRSGVIPQFPPVVPERNSSVVDLTKPQNFPQSNDTSSSSDPDSKNPYSEPEPLSPIDIENLTPKDESPEDMDTDEKSRSHSSSKPLNGTLYSENSHGSITGELFMQKS